MIDGMTTEKKMMRTRKPKTMCMISRSHCQGDHAPQTSLSEVRSQPAEPQFPADRRGFSNEPIDMIRFGFRQRVTEERSISQASLTSSKMADCCFHHRIQSNHAQPSPRAKFNPSQRSITPCAFPISSPLRLRAKDGRRPRRDMDTPGRLARSRA